MGSSHFCECPIFVVTFPFEEAMPMKTMNMRRQLYAADATRLAVISNRLATDGKNISDFRVSE